MMLVAMSLASCKSSNKPAAAEASRIGEIPEALQDIIGIEKYDSLIDYSLAENWLDVPAAMVKDGVLDAAADGLKAVRRSVSVVPSAHRQSSSCRSCRTPRSRGGSR